MPLNFLSAQNFSITIGTPERSARLNISKRDKGLDDFMPNRKDVRNPKTEYLLKEFEDIVCGCAKLPDGNEYYFVSELNELQKNILEVLGPTET